MASKLNGRNLAEALNTWAVSVVRYSTGIVKWSKNEMKEMDRKTRKIMCMYRALHSRADVDRICLPRKAG